MGEGTFTPFPCSANPKFSLVNKGQIWLGQKDVNFAQDLFLHLSPPYPTKYVLNIYKISSIFEWYPRSTLTLNTKCFYLGKTERKNHN